MSDGDDCSSFGSAIDGRLNDLLRFGVERTVMNGKIGEMKSISVFPSLVDAEFNLVTYLVASSNKRIEGSLMRALAIAIRSVESENEGQK